MSTGVVVVNFNNASDTIDCILSLATALSVCDRLYVIDNGSILKEWETLAGFIDQNKQSFSHIELIRLDENSGFAAGHNVGIKRSLSDRMRSTLILNNDTIVHPKFLREMQSTLYTDKSLGIVGGKIFFHDEPSILWTIGGTVVPNSLGSRYYGNGEEDLGQYDNKTITHISGCAALFCNDCLKEVGILDEEFFFRGEEWDICYRINRAGYKAKLSPNAKIYHKVSRTVARYSKFDIYCAYRAKFIFAQKHFNKVKYLLSFPFVWLYMVWKYNYFKAESQKRKNNFMSFGEYVALVCTVAMDQICDFKMKNRIKRLSK